MRINENKTTYEVEKDEYGTDSPEQYVGDASHSIPKSHYEKSHGINSLRLIPGVPNQSRWSNHKPTEASIDS